jgi:hypothetical protein
MAVRQGIWALLVLLAASSLLCYAQTSSSSVSGTVTDMTGAVVPGATATLTNEATGIVVKQKTSGSGIYAFPSVAAGKYTLTMEASGFKKEQRTGIPLIVETPATVNIQMQLGQATETVTVEAQATTLNTSNATLGDVVTHQVVEKLPLNGRNPLNLVILQAGATQSSGGGVNVNGARTSATNVTIDGIDANESTNPSITNNIYHLNPDNTQEFKVTTSNPTSEEGRNSGANVSIATRAGTNKLRGSLWEYFRNTKLDATDFYANANGVPRQEIHNNQYGFEVGGPLKRNKTFFYGSYEGQYGNYALPITESFGTVSLYTATARQGIFRYFKADPKNPFVLNGVRITGNSPALVDPKTGALAAGVRNCGSSSDVNCVASYNIAANDPRAIGLDSTIASQLASYPAANNFATGDGLNTASYFWNSPFQARGPHYLSRIDHTFGERDSIFGRYMYSQQTSVNGDPLNSRPQIFPNTPPLGEVFRPSHNFALNYKHTFSPSMINSLTVGFSRFDFLFTQGEANPAFPDVPKYTYNNVTTPFSATPRTERVVTTPQLVEDLTMLKGAHIIRVGGNVRLYEHNDIRGQPGSYNLTPTISLSATTRPPSGFATPAIGSTSVAGISSTDNAFLLNSINDLMGIPASISQRFLGNLNTNTYSPYLTNGKVTLFDLGNRLKQYDTYIQDEWKVKRNLTINAGLRWEINTPATEAAGRVYVPDRAINGSQGPVTFVKANSFWQRTNLGAIAPRLGIAWSPGADGKTIIRTGYGISFDPITSFQVTAASSSVPGLVSGCTDVVGGAVSTGCAGVPDIRIAQGFPQQLAPPSIQPTSFLSLPAQVRTNAPNVTVISPNLKLPTVHEWNFTIQHQFAGDFLISAGYVGNRGTRLFNIYDANQISAGPILPSFLAMQQNVRSGCAASGSGCPAGITAAAVPIVQQGIVNAAFVNTSTTATDIAQNAAGNFATRIENTTLAAHLRPNQQFATIAYLDNSADSYYHSFQFVTRKTFKSGLVLALNYTWAKSIDDASSNPVGVSAGGGISATSSSQAVDINNFRLNRAPSDFDRTHVLIGTVVYELPFGRGKRFLSSSPGWVNALVGGWGVNALPTFETGEPFSVYSGSLTNNGSHQSYAVLSGTTVPDPHLQNVAGSVGPALFADASGFALPAAGSNGGSRNSFRGPGLWTIDASVNKAFALTERFHLEFRAEAFNALNHTNFYGGTTNILSASFGRNLSAVSTASSRNTIPIGEPGRAVQLALKLRF